MRSGKHLGIGAVAAALVLAVASVGLAADESAAKIKDSGSSTIMCLTGDTGNPSATITISPTTMWPPNHLPRAIDLSLSLNSVPSVPPEDVSLTVNSVVSDQQSEDDLGHHGCGKPTAKQGPDVPTTLPTVSGALSTTADALTTSFDVRAERCAKVGDRHYTVSVTCCNTDDLFCDATPETLTVTVPKKKPKKP